ncbi:hypothetical protein ACSHFV_001979 [Escherichia coli]
MAKQKCTWLFAAINRSQRNARPVMLSDKAQSPEKQQKTLNRYGSASKLSSRQQIPV